MEQQSILFLEFEAGEQLGTTLRQILESCPDPDFISRTTPAMASTLPIVSCLRLFARQKPLLILLVLPHVQLKSLDALFQDLNQRASSAPIVVVVEADQEELIELVRPSVDDFIIRAIARLGGPAACPAVA